MKTRSDLIYRTLRNLGVLPQGATPSAEEYQSISDLIDAMLADLNARNIIWIDPNFGSFEDAHFVQLGHLLAWKAASEFGTQNDAGLAALATQAELQLKEIDGNDVRYLHMRTMRSDYPTRTSLVCPSTYRGT